MRELGTEREKECRQTHEREEPDAASRSHIPLPFHRGIYKCDEKRECECEECPARRGEKYRCY